MLELRGRASLSAAWLEQKAACTHLCTRLGVSLLLYIQGQNPDSIEHNPTAVRVILIVVVWDCEHNQDTSDPSPLVCCKPGWRPVSIDRIRTSLPLGQVRPLQFNSFLTDYRGSYTFNTTPNSTQALRREIRLPCLMDLAFKFLWNTQIMDPATRTEFRHVN
ncbi:hypothetical protein BDN72DRAFT_156761 [Pluteus cervinus]|uniref:Uncharacterized protein n=1 Tax=Pluteus cervinus TaxID=181527 RepID=A0ACD3AL25_9AGAR|nr:hypothetical protein BDN72DRAFT_156761 [Pluteus cervinus]